MASSFLQCRWPRVKADDIWISGSVDRDGGGRRRYAGRSCDHLGQDTIAVRLESRRQTVRGVLEQRERWKE
jgi:hypothetical protein